MSEPELSWRPLGRLFVEKGLLTELRLEHALEEQARTGGPLGEKLVALGYVTSTALARLLAEQYGVELALDTGFGTGLRAELERRLDGDGDTEAEVAPAKPPKLTLVEPLQQAAPAEMLAGLEEQWAKLAAAESRIEELEQRIVELTGQLRERDDRLAELAATPARPKKRSTKPAA